MISRGGIGDLEQNLTTKQRDGSREGKETAPTYQY